MTEQAKWVGRGRQIISAVILDHGIHPDDFFGHSRFTHLVKARRDAAQRLVKAGFSHTQTGRLMKRDSSTIINYASPEVAKSKLQYSAHRRLLTHLNEDVRSVVIAAAAAEGVTPYVLMAQWIGERAFYEVEAKQRAAA